MWVEEVLPAVLYAAAFHSFSPLTLFDCERRREEKEWREGGHGRCQELSAQPLPLFILEEGRQEGEGEGRRGQTFAGLSGIISQPPSDLRRSVLSSLPPPPNASSHPFMLISATLLRALPSFLFLSLIFPLFCCWGNAIWHG